MTPAEARARVRCPRCHEQVIDLDMRAWFDAGRTPDDFADAVGRLLHAHSDSCTPRPPAYTRPMRNGRRIWRFGAWFPAGWFILLGLTHVTGLITSDRLLGWSVLAAGACLAMSALREKTNYRSGYARGHFAANNHQPYLDARWLHPGDGPHDPADPDTRAARRDDHDSHDSHEHDSDDEQEEQ